MKYKIVDLFCGCGGISRGFERTGRFGTQLGVEIEPHPARTFAQNIKNVDGAPARTYVGDIDDLLKSEAVFWNELALSGITEPGELDVLTGGPPCQGFSRNGIRFFEDERNHLYKSFVRAISLTLPKLVLVENVREFLNFGGGKFSSDLLKWFEELGYHVQFQKINAADFGVPQKRYRVFFIAVRNDVVDRSGMGPEFPSPKFIEQQPDDLISGSHTHRTVLDALGDLPKPSDTKDMRSQPYESNADLSDFAKLMRSKSGAVPNHFARTLTAKQVARINAVGTGRMRDVDKSLQTKKFYGSAYRRLAWNEPALTITTWVYHVGSGRFAHPTEDRGVTMREAARLQSFDDDFVFPALVNPVSQMIGNAVPPLVAEAIATKFAYILDTYRQNNEPQRPKFGYDSAQA